MRAFRYGVFGLLMVGTGFFAVHFALRGVAQTVTDVTGCRAITASGSYRLVSDIDTTNADCIYVRGNYSNITFDGNGKSINTPNRVFDVADLGSGTPSNITITNLTSTGDVRVFGDATHHVTIQNSSVGGIAVYGSDDVTIQNNTIGAGGVSINNSDSAGVFPLRPVVTGNTITGGSTNVKILFELVGGSNHPCPRTDAVFTGNTITDTRADAPTEANAAVRIRCATHNTFSNNTVHSTATTIGLYIRDESDYGTYENNTFWSHDEEAFRMASGNLDKTFPANNVFRNNVFHSDNVATLFFQGQGLYNTFQNNIFWGASGGLSGVEGGLGTVWDHNTFYVTNTGQLTTLTYRSGPPPERFTNNIFDYSGTSLFGYDGWVVNPYSGDRNLFYNRAGAVSFGSRGASLSAWRTSNSSDANSIEANPLFVDPANGDFHLQSGSPARGIGTGGSDVGAMPFSVPGCTEHWVCPDWQACSGSQQSRTCTDTNACGTTAYQPNQLQSCDVTVPVTSITSPTSNSTVAGTVSITATSTDNYYSSGVQFQVDGTNVGGLDTSSPYGANWNTTQVGDGQHTITAHGYDAAGNMSTTTTNVIVHNGAACVEDWLSIPCSAWSACSNGTQTRTCTDANNCGTTNNRPALTQSCTAPDTTAPAAVQNLQAS